MPDDIMLLAKKCFPNLDFNDFGRLIQFCYHHKPNKVLYIVTLNVYSKYIQGCCLNWFDDTDSNQQKFERPFYTNHIVGDIVDCSSGEILSPRQFYENYVTLYHPNRKFGDSLPSNNSYNGIQICFTGFPAKRKAELKDLAKGANLWVTDEVRQNLEYLVCGSNAGPKKIEKAQKLGAAIWEENDFLIWLQNQ